MTRSDNKRCIHFWIIETANGQMSQGICKYCGEVKDFCNSWPDSRNTGYIPAKLGGKK